MNAKEYYPSEERQKWLNLSQECTDLTIRRTAIKMLANTAIEYTQLEFDFDGQELPCKPTLLPGSFQLGHGV